MHGSRGCLGCCTKPPLIISVDEPSEGLTNQGHRVKRPREGFWSSSTDDMEIIAFPSEGSFSPISTDQQGTSSSSTSNPTEFVNHGLLLWNQTRQLWIGDKESKRPKQPQEPKLGGSATYESLLSTNKPYPQPIPLPEMVDFLFDIWEQEGLYD